MSAMKPRELEAVLAGPETAVVVDLRTPEEFAGGTIVGARNLPWADDLAAQLAAELPREARIIFVCAWGHRSVVAAIAMRREGFRRVSYLEGGLEAWGLAGLPTTRAPRGASQAVIR